LLKALRPPPVTLSELSADGCKWPVVDNADGIRGRHLFCGAERDEGGGSYCAEHRELSVEPDEPWSDEERAILKMLRAGKLR
jgi:hypothetical protein